MGLQKYLSNRDSINVSNDQKGSLGGMGFDKALVNDQNPFKYPNWITRYFSENESQYLQLPYRLPGVGIPTPLLKGNNETQEFTEGALGMFKEFASKQPVTIKDSMNMSKGQYQLNSDGATRLTKVIEEAMLYASGVDSILNNRQSIDKASNNIINGQTTNDEETDMLDRSDPKNFGEVAHGYKKDLAEILPFTGSNRTHELINFAHGFTEDGRQANLQTLKLQTPAWQMPQILGNINPTKSGTDGRQMLWDGVSKLIRHGQAIPQTYAETFQTREAFLNKRHKNPWYDYEEKAEAYSRFSQK